MNTLQINTVRCKKQKNLTVIVFDRFSSFASFVLTYFHLSKGRITLLLSETTVGIFLHLKVFICKAFITLIKTPVHGASSCARRNAYLSKSILCNLKDLFNVLYAIQK